MHTIRIRCWALWLGVLTSHCIDPHLVNLSNVELRLPEPQPRAAWQREVSRLLERYAAAPVLTPGDERIEPLFGGLTTLSYFGADAQRRLQDQQIPAAARTHGHSLEAACSATRSDQADALATTGMPVFTPVWIPLALRGGPAPDSATCDEFGQPLAPHEHTTFCSFARLALQPSERTLIVVAHGLFDSGAQDYVLRMAALLYAQGHSVLIPDLRDHGATLRAAPQVATTLGTLEGPDLLALVQRLRARCAAHFSRAGIAGVSGGGLDAIRAFTLDQHNLLDAGVVALSPLLDVNAAIRDLAQTGSCAITSAVELTSVDQLAITGLAGAAVFGGAALVQGLKGRALDADTAVAGAIGAAVGLLSGLVIDAWFDGGATPCVSQNAIARLVTDTLQARWRTLRAQPVPTMSAAGRQLQPAAVRLDDYVRERGEFLATRMEIKLQRFAAPQLTRELHAALDTGARPEARLLVLGADDDPMTRLSALRTFVRGTAGMRHVYTRAVAHGGHGAMWLVQPKVMERIFERFFAP